MTFKFKVGDKVRHRKAWDCGYNPPFLMDKEQILQICKIDGNMLHFNYINGGWIQSRFQPVEVYRKPEEAKKDDADKSRLDILFGCRGIDEVGHVFAYGAKKYEQYNWRKSGNDDSYKRRLVGAALRHLFAYLTGNRTDPETGKSHLAHAIADLAMVIDLENS